MSLWAIVPAKSPEGAKSRLAAAVPAPQRAALTRHLLERTLAATSGCPALAGTLVLSASPAFRALAAEWGALARPDPPIERGQDALNTTVAWGCRHVAALGATGALVLPTDLPLLTPAGIEQFLRASGRAAVALAPDWAGQGTNALLLRPPLALAPLFGPDSLARHQAAARERGLSVVAVYVPALAHDLDTPADLALLCRAAASLPESLCQELSATADSLRLTRRYGWAR